MATLAVKGKVPLSVDQRSGRLSGIVLQALPVITVRVLTLRELTKSFRLGYLPGSTSAYII
jgi:hypothetical protein